MIQESPPNKQDSRLRKKTSKDLVSGRFRTASTPKTTGEAAWDPSDSPGASGAVLGRCQFQQLLDLRGDGITRCRRQITRRGEDRGTRFWGVKGNGIGGGKG